MARKREPERLTDTRLKGLKADPAGEYEVRDISCPGMFVRVTAAGTRVFVYKGRFGNAKNPTRRTLGYYDPAHKPQPGDESVTGGPLSLEQAREKARTWRALVKAGKDPAAVEADQAEAKAALTEGMFANVALQYIVLAVIGASAFDPADKRDLAEQIATVRPKTPLQRQWQQTSRDIRKVLIPRFGQKHVTDLTRLDVTNFLHDGVRTPGHTRNLFITLQSLIGWARDQNKYGLVHSPCDSVKPSKILGVKRTGTRVLDDEEIRALWLAGAMRYPTGPVYRLLALTGLRKNEVAQAAWSEFDFENRRWIIPAERMKGRNSTAREHLVPITDDVLALLRSLPRLGPYVFSMNGKTPVHFGGDHKAALDARMTELLGELTPFQTHDIRRTVRTRLSGLHVKEEVREAILAHARPGTKKNYDVYEYEVEKRDALELWALQLNATVDGRRANVVPLLRGAS